MDPRIELFSQARKRRHPLPFEDTRDFALQRTQPLSDCRRSVINMRQSPLEIVHYIEELYDDSANAGTLNGNVFSEIENLTGGTQADTFIFGAAGSLSGTINGGSLTGIVDTLDFSAKSGPIDVNLATRTANDLGSFTLIESIIGTSAPGTALARTKREVAR